MTDGKTYDIHHPDFLWIRLREAYVATSTIWEENRFERCDILDVFHIVRIEPLA